LVKPEVIVTESDDVISVDVDITDGHKYETDSEDEPCKKRSKMNDDFGFNDVFGDVKVCPDVLAEKEEEKCGESKRSFVEYIAPSKPRIRFSG
jgi:hypothetical protein